jgi:hypothetical protein
MPDYQEIYRTQAETYDLLVSREDHQGNLLRALNQVRPMDGLDVVELGAGTGRLTCMVAPVVRTLLEQAHGFSRTWIRTDYRFASLPEAEDLTRFFFGDGLADRVADEALVVLPECTGIWWVTR